MHMGQMSQKNVLEEMITTMTSLKVCGHRGLLPIQNGLIVSSKSLSGLDMMFKNKHEISFLHTNSIKTVEHFLLPFVN